MTSSINLLLAANFLHSVGQGIITAPLAPHICCNGGNQITLGLMGGGTFIFQVLSKDAVTLFQHGARFILKFSLVINFICYMLMVFYTSAWVVVLTRFVQTIFNQIYPYSQKYVDAVVESNDKIKVNNYLDIMKTIGLSFGCVIGGYVYYCTENFTSNSMLAAILDLTAILIIDDLEEDITSGTEEEVTEAQNNLRRIPDVCIEQLKNLREVDYKEQWDVLLLTATYILSFMLYFGRFGLLIAYNYSGGIVLISYTIAYHTMLVFATNFLVPVFRKWATENLFDYMLLLCSVLLVGIYYAPTYECYLILFIPLVMCYSVVNSYMNEDILGLRRNQQMSEALDALVFLTNTIGSVFFGIICQLFDGKGFKIMTMLPMAVCLYEVNRRVVQKPKPKEETKED